MEYEVASQLIRESVAEFDDYLGGYEIHTDDTEYGKRESYCLYIPGMDRRILIWLELWGYTLVNEYDHDEIKKFIWQQVAQAWLNDPNADHGKPRKLRTKQKNPWTRPDRPQPSELSEREESVRFRLSVIQDSRSGVKKEEVKAKAGRRKFVYK